MKDQTLLILTGILCAIGAVAFWKLSGNWGFAILNLIVISSLLLDNYRLRKSLVHIPERRHRRRRSRRGNRGHRNHA